MSDAAKKLDQSDNSLKQIAAQISELTGNQFGEKQYSMIESRLKKRSLDLGLHSLEDYYSYFWKHKDQESKNLISILTTHHTYFFREFSQFEYLETKALPELLSVVRQRPDKTIRLWSAACSRGQEVYSLAMFMDHFLKKFAPDLTYSILGTDIDPESVSIGSNGVYTRKEVKEIPLAYLADHWARGTGEIAEFVRAKDSLRKKTRWEVMNLLQLSPTFKDQFDIIFCRNVFIYFNHQQIKTITTNMLNHLSGDGYFFAGISESLNGLSLPVASQGPSIYRHAHKIVKPVPTRETKLTSQVKEPVKPTTSSPVIPVQAQKDVLRVVCVDDSPSIHTLMKKILAPEEGFEIVGNAINGIDAAAKIKELKPDVITLDIHMPEQTGLEYLMKNFNGTHPPVVMVSSVSREDSDLAISALKAGASDYVEKPAFNNLAEIGEEIRRKLRAAYRNKVVYHDKGNLGLDESFKRPQVIEKPERFVRVIVAHLSDKQRLSDFFQGTGHNQPPTVVLIEGSPHALPEFAKSLRAQFVEAVPSLERADQVFVMDSKTLGESVVNKYKDRPASFLIFGEPSKRTVHLTTLFKTVQVLSEDLGGRNTKNPLKASASDIVPVTSYAYMSSEYLGRQK